MVIENCCMPNIFNKMFIFGVIENACLKHHRAHHSQVIKKKVTRLSTKKLVKQEIVFKKDKATLPVTSKICENTVNYYN